jgi:hypothetical protein
MTDKNCGNCANCESCSKVIWMRCRNLEGWVQKLEDTPQNIKEQAQRILSANVGV